MSSEIIDKTEFIIQMPSSNISVTITDGELSYVDRWGTRSEYTHDLEKHPNWERAERMLECIYKYNREEFLSIAKLLKKDSQGYAVIKRIVQTQLADSDTQISKIMKESEFLKSF